MKEYRVKVNNKKTQWRNLEGELHREDGPAVEWADGTKSWWLNGQRHREDGPAIEYADGDKKWFLNGQCHREDGPAIEYANGVKWWYRNGQRHRDDPLRRRGQRQASRFATVGKTFDQCPRPDGAAIDQGDRARGRRLAAK